MVYTAHKWMDVQHRQRTSQERASTHHLKFYPILTQEIVLYIFT